MNFLPIQKTRKTLLVVAAILVCGGGVGLISAASYREIYRDRIFPGVVIDGVAVGGFSPAIARVALERRIDRAIASGILFRVDADRLVRIPIVAAALHDPDASHDLLRYDLEGVLTQAMSIGRRGPLAWQWMESVGRRMRPAHLTIPVAVDERGITRALQDRLNDRMIEPQNATLHISIEKMSGPVVTITPERPGHAYDLPAAFVVLRVRASNLSFNDPIMLRATVTMPTVVATNIEEASRDLPRWLAHLPLTLTAESSSFTLTSSTVVTWLQPKRNGAVWTLALQTDLVETSLRPLLDPFLKQAKTGSLTKENDRAKTFVPPVEGITLDVTTTVSAMAKNLLDGSGAALITLMHEQPAIHGDAEALGIREVIGVGRSNFSGSPVNRRKNIALGAQKVNGALIAPDQEFSLLKTLGKVDGDHGWLPELVIKGNKTTPEFGGGLCQIGTTTFRSALGSGLPITERRNHSYRVRYYEPAGTDATIYEPAPDFKFVNDTGHWLLITTEIKHDDLTFTVWGTRDGRRVEQTTSRLSNIVPPPEKKIVETLDLKPGATKCTEIAHAGADAQFDYTVTYLNGVPKKTTFYSHYRPWGAVCLLGVATLSTSTSPTIDESGVNNPN